MWKINIIQISFRIVYICTSKIYIFSYRNNSFIVWNLTILSCTYINELSLVFQRKASSKRQQNLDEKQNHSCFYHSHAITAIKRRSQAQRDILILNFNRETVAVMRRMLYSRFNTFARKKGMRRRCLEALVRSSIARSPYTSTASSRGRIARLKW